MIGLWAQLTPEQQKRVLEFDGPEIVGRKEDLPKKRIG